MSRPNKITGYVLAVCFAAVLFMALGWNQRAAFPGVWPSLVLLAVAFLLQVAPTTARGGGAEGSLSFIVHQATGILFGPFWGGAVAAVSTAISQLIARRTPLKILFNVSQRTFSLVAAVLVYRLMGGSIPPDYLVPGAEIQAGQVVPQVVAFFASALVYFLLNSLLVSGAVSLSSGRSVRNVWTTSVLWVLGYDIGASSLALLVSWVYLRFPSEGGLSKLGFLAIFLPIIAARHIYAKLNQLKGLYDELDSAYERLELNVREQLEMMVKSIEARDPYTSGHSRRVAALSSAIASDLGLDVKLTDEIENAALLHDVGKIHAEFAPLLSKEGRLTEEEWEIMKTHATKSAELVGLFSRFRGNVLDSVRWHHERWDGKGYPDGIAGEAIPLGARIIMVADTIDAMTTDRPYRNALSFDTVVSELHKYRGVQFDPTLVDVTVSSVTVRRLVSDRDFLAEKTVAIKAAPKRPTRPALRSQKSFWEGLRASVGQE